MVFTGPDGLLQVAQGYEPQLQSRTNRFPTIGGIELLEDVVQVYLLPEESASHVM